MENMLNLGNTINKIELFSYFSPEILCLIAIFLNLFFFLFFKNKLNVKRISDFVTVGAFSINTIILICFFVRNNLVFNESIISLFNNLIIFSNEISLYKIFINLFFIFFILCTYKIIRKARFKTPIINSYLLLLAAISSLLLQVQNNIFAFILLDISAFLIYKYASSMRIRRGEVYSPDFVVMSTMATILFYAFYLLTCFIQDELQLAIINVCITMSLMLKAGLFPVYNYTLNRHYKNNIAYSSLLFTFLPFLGIVSLSKFISTIDLSSEVYLLTMLLFTSVLVFSCAINAYKTKNLVKYLANSSYVYFVIIAMALFMSQDVILCNSSALMFAFALLCAFNFLCILKINLKPDKINFSVLTGLFIRNRGFCTLFTISLLVMLNVLPTQIMTNNFEIIKGIYLFDKAGSWLAFLAFLANVLILFNGLFAIKTCYTKPSMEPFELTKRTTPNYVVPLMIIISLFVKMFFN